MTRSRLASLQNHLDELAATTWHKVAVGPLRGLTFGEEGLTDHNLFALDRAHSMLSVYKFDKSEESLNGADFDWWVGSESTGWIGMRFQAKKLSDGIYSELGHYVRGQRQYDLLLREAHGDGMWPFFCFYNGWNDPWPIGTRNLACPRDRTPVPLSEFPRKGEGRCTHVALDHFGCAVAPAPAVRDQHRGPRRERLALEGYLALSVPWSRLFAAAAASEQVGDSADEILTALEGSLRAATARVELDTIYPSRHLELPGWVRAVIDGERDELRYTPRPRVLVLHYL